MERRFVGDDENRLVEFGIHHLLANDHPSNDHRLVVLLGPPGTGKTLLANGLAVCFAQHHNARVLHTNASDWARFVVRDRTQDRIAAWRASCRDISLLVLDDLDHLSGRFAAQCELCWLLDDLNELDIPAVLTSSVCPLSANGLTTALVSRVVGGLAIRLKPPGTSARCQIIQQLSSELGWTLSSEAAYWLATEIEGTVPEIKSILFRTLPIRSGGGRTVSLTQIQTLIHNQQDRSTLPPQVIIGLVAELYGVSKKVMTGKSRRRAALQARRLAIYLIRRHCGYTLQMIGRLFGDRDHTTILHACRKTESLLAEDAELSEIAESIVEMATHRFQKRT